MKTDTIQSIQPSNIITQIFKSEIIGENELRVIGTYEQPLFVAKDIAAILGYTNERKAIRDHIDNEDKISAIEYEKTKGNNSFPLKLKGETILINESGLYSLILRSKLDKAKQFKRWVTSEVLPSIRKTGQFKIEQLELQLQESQKILELRDKEIKKITQNHEQYLKRKRRDVFEIGNVVYVLSNKAFTCYFKTDYDKIGKATQKSNEGVSAFMRRLSTYNVRGLPLTNPILLPLKDFVFVIKYETKWQLIPFKVTSYQ